MSDLKTVEGRLEAASTRHAEIDRAILARAQSGETLPLDELTAEASEFQALTAEINQLTETKGVLTARLESVKQRDSAIAGPDGERMGASGVNRWEGFQRQDGTFHEGGPMRLQAAMEGNTSIFAPALDVSDPTDWVAAFNSLPNVRNGNVKNSGWIAMPGMLEAAFGPTVVERVEAARRARLEGTAATAGPGATQGLQTDIPHLGVFPREPLITGVIDIVPRVQVNSLQFATSNQSRLQRPGDNPRTIGEASRAEGAAANEVYIRTSRNEHTIQRIAAWTGFTEDQVMLEPFFAQLVNVQIPQYIREETEEQILQGTGTAPQLNGIMTQTTQTANVDVDAANVGGFNLWDAVADAKAVIRKANGLTPTHVVVQPDVTAVILKARTDAQPLVPMMSGSAMMPLLCGLPVVETQFLPAYANSMVAAIVGAFGDSRACTLYTAGTPMMETTTSHGELFVEFEVVARIRWMGVWVEEFTDAFHELVRND